MLQIIYIAKPMFFHSLQSYHCLLFYFQIDGSKCGTSGNSSRQNFGSRDSRNFCKSWFLSGDSLHWNRTANASLHVSFAVVDRYSMSQKQTANASLHVLVVVDRCSMPWNRTANACLQVSVLLPWTSLGAHWSVLTLS